MYLSMIKLTGELLNQNLSQFRGKSLLQSWHIGANLIPDSVFKPMSKNQNDDNDCLRLFSIVFFAVESDSGVKWSLKLVKRPKKEDLEA